jgi:hypothetical protein
MNHFAAIDVLLLVIYLWIVMQQIVVGTIFIGALAYVGNLIFQSFRAKRACASGCGKCSVETTETSLKPRP